jgi:hypothetical protein
LARTKAPKRNAHQPGIGAIDIVGNPLAMSRGSLHNRSNDPAMHGQGLIL